MTFQEILKLLSHPLDRAQIKQRWGDRDKTFQLDYIEWATAADLLDQHAVDWSFEIITTEVHEDTVMVRGKLTIAGVSRENIGAAVIKHPMENSFKDAASDCLKRCAVLFGVGRELYSKDAPSHDNAGTSSPRPVPANPLAKSVSELATPKQIVMIRAICRDLDVDCDAELKEAMKLDCKVEELSRRAASAFIDHLKRVEAERGDSDVLIVAAHTNQPVQAQPEPVQATNAGITIADEFDRENVIAEINVGFDDMRLNAGQRKEYVMRTLGLRAAIELEKCSNEQLQILCIQISEDL